MAMMAAPMSLEADQGTADAVEGGQLLHVDSAFHIQGVLIRVDMCWYWELSNSE